MAYLIDKIEKMDEPENVKIETIKEDEEEIFDITKRPDTKFEQGYLTHQGVELEDGSIAIQRQKAKKQADMTDEENDTLERWTNQACREYPNADRFWMESIAYYCLMKPDEAKTYAENNQDKLYQSRATQNDCWDRIEKENPHIKRI